MHHIDRTEIQEQLTAKGIDVEHIRSLHLQLTTGKLDHSSFVIDAHRLELPTEKDIIHYEDIHSSTYEQVGIQALQNDKLLLFWLNGGAATRYFDAIKVAPQEQDRYATQLAMVTEHMRALPKGVTPVIEDMSYLELKIRNLLEVTRRHQLATHPQVIMMNSFITDAATRDHLETLFIKYPDLDPARFHFVIQQPSIPRFQKVEDLKNIDLFVDSNDKLSFAPCGHGDFIYLLQEYIKQVHIPNVEYMFFTNIDNVGATIDPYILGHHIMSGTQRTVELATKEAGDQGGAPYYVDGELMIVEQMKLPKGFDQSKMPWFNTNSFWFSLSSLLSFREDLPLILAEKSIDEGDVYQLEHFACDVHVPSHYLVIPRQRRFWPIKRYVDLLMYKDSNANTKIHYNFKQLLHDEYSVNIP